jgi:hypothetical protein
LLVAAIEKASVRPVPAKLRPEGTDPIGASATRKALFLSPQKLSVSLTMRSIRPASSWISKLHSPSIATRSLAPPRSASAIRSAAPPIETLLTMFATVVVRPRIWSRSDAKCHPFGLLPHLKRAGPPKRPSGTANRPSPWAKNQSGRTIGRAFS